MQQGTPVEVIDEQLPVAARLIKALYELNQRYLEPAWIILGKMEFHELQSEGGSHSGVDVLASDFITRFHGVKIATVPIAHHLEVVPRLP